MSSRSRNVGAGPTTGSSTPATLNSAMITTTTAATTTTTTTTAGSTSPIYATTPIKSNSHNMVAGGGMARQTMALAQVQEEADHTRCVQASRQLLLKGQLDSLRNLVHEVQADNWKFEKSSGATNSSIHHGDQHHPRSTVVSEATPEHGFMSSSLL